MKNILISYPWVRVLKADSKALKDRVERERQEEHEGAERGVSLEVDMQVLATALQVRARPVAVPVAMGGLWYERGNLLSSRPQLPTVQNDPLQNEDDEEAGSHDELWQGEIALFHTDRETLIGFNV